MQVIDLYENLHLNRYFDGGANLYKAINIDLNSLPEVFKKLDEICLSNSFTPLGNVWEEINSDSFQILLQSALQFNIGFLNNENMSLEESKIYYDQLMKHFDINKCKLFTSWHNNPWRRQEGSIASTTFSDATIDLAISVVDYQKILFFYVLFED